MTTRTNCSIAVCIAALFVGCAKSSEKSDQAPGQQTGGAGSGGASGSAGSQHPGAGGQSAGTGGKPSEGTGGVGDGTCAPDTQIPALCRMCKGNACGTPTCSGGKFVGFTCPEDADAGTTGSGGSGVCNLACAKGKHCELKPTATCVDDATDAGVDASAGNAPLHWFRSCGLPVCSTGDALFNDPNIPNCTTQEFGQPCTTSNETCDGLFTCGSVLVCAAQMPTQCPISRARYKQDIRYLDDAERAQFHDQLTHLPLASYRYKTAPDVPQLGFMIDDIEPSAAVSGDHVNLYGYLSMAVAAIQVQDRQIKALEQQVEALRAQLDESSGEALCKPEPHQELVHP